LGLLARKEGRKQRPFLEVLNTRRQHIEANSPGSKQNEDVVEMNHIFDFTTVCVTMSDP
jgi:hypothetical protein